MNPLDDKLRQITLEAFESLCHIFPLAPEQVARSFPLQGTVSIDFSGPLRGTFRLAFHGQLRQIVAEAMLESSPSVQDEEDAIKELTNVICGNMLPYVAGPAPVFTLTSPQCQAPPTSLPVPETAISANVAFPKGSVQMSLVLSD